ncbi:hypothetical protein RUM44_004153 [Polyplax serrata]|uniref:Pre-mRNA polyadenylation factor Fip1 domain-containing protein n=1 Tax=Polyplax serrata TaxID=468196 RepID=A0ABR1B205_POLSC
MADEDERWLYGDCNQDENEQEKETNETAEKANTEVDENVNLKPAEFRIEPDNVTAENDGKEETEKTTEESPEKMDVIEEEEKKENGECENENEKKKENEEEEDEDDEEDDEDDDSDEDNVNVIIGDLNKSGPTYTNINIPKRGPTITGPGVKSAGKFSMEDFESVGIINGVPAHDFNVDGIEDKPWRIPGADITDYFNYGFNEETWKAYCERQKRIRIHESCTGLPTQTMTGQTWANAQGGQNAQYSNSQSAGGKKSGWETGQIRVIGSGVASRRLDETAPENQNIQVIPSNNNFSGLPLPNMMPQIIPPMEMPPPGGDHYGGGPAPNDYFNPEPDYFSSYEPTAADQWRDGWSPGNLVTFGQSVKPVHSHLDDSNSQDRSSKDREKDRDRDHDSDRDRERNLDRDDKEKRKERPHRTRSRSKSHERKRKSRSRSPSHKKHKKKSKKSDRKKRSDDTE